MIGRLNHVAVATPDAAASAAFYRDVMGAEVSGPEPLPEHGVTTIFVDLPNTRIELLEPLGDNSPLAGFLKKHPIGGIHHVCYEVADVAAARDRLLRAGMTLTGDGTPRIGAHGNPVIFLHPKDAGGVLVELEQTGAGESA